MARVICVGSVNIDHTIEVPRLPALGETVSSSGQRTDLGGKGANQCLAAARAGVTGVLIGCVGTDIDGVQAIASLKAHGVNTTSVRMCPGVPTGRATILVDVNGGNSIVLAAGANGHVGEQEIESLKSILMPQDIVLCQGEVPTEIVERVLRASRDAGATSILNTAPVDSVGELVTLADIVIANETEARWLSGVADGGPTEVIRALAERGLERVIITLGKSGGIVRWDDTEFDYPAIEVESVDSVAAGDAFVGAFSASLSRGQSVKESVRYGAAAGAVATTRRGAQSAIPSNAEIRRLLDSRVEVQQFF